MFIGLCFTTSTIHGNLLNTFAISTNLSFKIAHFLTHSTPKACSPLSQQLLRRVRRRRRRRLAPPLHFENLLNAFIDSAALRLIQLYAVYDGAAVDADFIAK
jgi:hypothetical protein